MLRNNQSRIARAQKAPPQPANRQPIVRMTNIAPVPVLAMVNLGTGAIFVIRMEGIGDEGRYFVRTNR
ncbi:hypothetical protein COLSTE_02401 [Collinsella stercoris DSM 13279]|uniref:Uncharacterized protein n=1 Tax=Collinsella stercoris DSM 13279 TaxID=445975 RepID=B6GE64_9ACTN|nr:hypothetical protein COLSTE_02401 [Collinsella stercoris DSM 13279]